MKKLLLVCGALVLLYLGFLIFQPSDRDKSQIAGAEGPAATPVENLQPTGGEEEADDSASPQAPIHPDQLPPTEPQPETSADPVRQPVLALTYDDGPSSEFTPQLLDVLQAHDVKATFFLVGNRVEKNPEIVLRAYLEGHSLNIHSYDHIERLPDMDDEELQRQISGTGELIARITENAPPQMVRPPFGTIDLETALRTGRPNMMWSVDPRDWDVRDAELVLEHVVEHAEDGDVIILHDLFETTVEATVLILEHFLEDGWRFVTLEELYAEQGITLEAGGIYRNPQSFKPPLAAE